MSGVKRLVLKTRQCWYSCHSKQRNRCCLLIYLSHIIAFLRWQSTKAKKKNEKKQKQNKSVIYKLSKLTAVRWFWVLFMPSFFARSMHTLSLQRVWWRTLTDFRLNTLFAFVFFSSYCYRQFTVTCDYCEYDFFFLLWTTRQVTFKTSDWKV